MSIEEATAFKHAKADAIVAPESGTILWEIGGDGECVKSIEPFIGKEYKDERKLLLQHLSGSSAFKNGRKEEHHDEISE